VKWDKKDLRLRIEQQLSSRQSNNYRHVANFCYRFDDVDNFDYPTLSLIICVWTSLESAAQVTCYYWSTLQNNFVSATFRPSVIGGAYPQIANFLQCILP